MFRVTRSQYACRSMLYWLNKFEAANTNSEKKRCYQKVVYYNNLLAKHMFIKALPN